MKAITEYINETKVEAVGNTYNILKLSEEEYDVIYNLVLMAAGGQLDVPELNEPAIKKAAKKLAKAIDEIDG